MSDNCINCVTNKRTGPDLLCDQCREPSELAPAAGSVDVREYLERRRRTIESSISAEVLAGNEWKEKCERTALAEITALEAWIANPQVH